MVGRKGKPDGRGMSDGSDINYGRFMERAMRSVMAEVLGQVAEHGLPGTHHFYITFDTTHPGVDIPEFLHERYPREMMIVLQEWFDDLAVMGDRFRVTLNFSNRPETLVVPFEAVKTFIDPSVKFGLKFDDQDEEDHDEAEAAAPAEEEGPGDDDPSGGGGSSAPQGTGQVVSLDKFRKG